MQKHTGSPEKLDYEQIVELLTTRLVLQFNHSTDITVAIDGGLIVVRRPDYPTYTFNERGAEEAVFDGIRLMMPDAQGFPCTFLLDVPVSQQDGVTPARARVEEKY